MTLRHGTRRRRTYAVTAAISAIALMPITLSAAAASGQTRTASSVARPLPFGLSPRDNSLMLAQIPLDKAAEQIRHAAGLAPAGQRGLVQIAVDDGHSALTVYWHGRVPAAIGRLSASLRHHIRVLFKPARYSLVTLERAVRTVVEGHHEVLSAVPLADGDGIEVGVSGRFPSLSDRAARADLGSAVPVQLLRVRQSHTAECTAPHASGDNAGPGSRCDDLAPGFWGGAVISLFSNYVYAWCSTGFGVHNPSGLQGMLTAGHCVRGPDVQSGTTWWNGQATTELGSTVHSPFQGTLTPSDDSGVIVTPAGSGDRYYDGPSIFAGDTHNTKVVVGQQSSNDGDWLCESGSFGGVKCGIQVAHTGATVCFNSPNPNSCVSPGFYISNVVETNGPQPIPGDSGGPVFSLAGTGEVTAKGTVTGDGQFGYYTPMNVITNDVVVTVNIP